MKQLSGILLAVLGILILNAIFLPAGAVEVDVEVLPSELGPGGMADPATVPVASLPLTFIPNRGQYNPAVSFVVSGPESTVFFLDREIVILAGVKSDNGSAPRMIRQTFPGAAEHPSIGGSDPRPGTANFLFGSDPSQWLAGVPMYGAVEYHELYPGISLRYLGSEGTLKREFTVDPGADPAAIRLRYEGVDSITVDDTGTLVLMTGTSSMRESPLVCYQEIGNRTVTVSAEYRVLGENEVVIVAGPYDPAYPLVIDPWLVYSTYIGGSDYDNGYTIDTDGNGYAYVAGSTYSSNYPITGGALDTSYGGSLDAVVTKLQPDGTGLVYSTYLGGTGFEQVRGITVDGSGNAYLTGVTGSADFPTTTGAYNRTYGTGNDAFVAKLNPAGNTLLYSTYLGGSGSDDGYDIAIDGSGNAYLLGNTGSSDFPVIPGAFNTSYSGGNDAYVAKLNPTGTSLVSSTYLGGSGSEQVRGLAVDAGGNMYVSGYTTSTDFPTTGGAYNPVYNGNLDVFVTKLDATGSTIVYSTFLGSPNQDYCGGMAVDGNGNAYVTGYVSSAAFPTTPGAFDRTLDGLSDAFITKLNPAGTGLVYSTLLGGPGSDQGAGIEVDQNGNAYVTGRTTSSTPFPVTAGAFNRTRGMVFLTKLNPAGNGLLYSTRIGGTGYDDGIALAIDGSSNAYLTGLAESANFPVTVGAYDRTFGGNRDIFVVKFAVPPQNAGIGVFRPSTHTFYLKNGSVTSRVNWGQVMDIPVTGDWNGDSLADVGVFNASQHRFLLKNGSVTTRVSWGQVTDIPLAGDWNRDGLDDVGVFRPSASTFYLKNGSVTTSFRWGSGSDTPLSGDWNGDGVYDIGVFRPATHTFYLKNGSVTTKIIWGETYDLPVTGDWNGDGMYDIGVFRPATHTFYLKNGSVTTKISWGETNDLPVAGRWQ